MAIQERGGVVIALNSGSAKGSPMTGGTGLLDAAIDTFVRNLALEAGPQGVRVNCIWTAGLPETLSKEALEATNPNLDLDDEAFAGLLANLDNMRATRRSSEVDARDRRHRDVPRLRRRRRDHRRVRQRHRRHVRLKWTIPNPA
jgi:NAD(P)-dependent dehydrogenase (short-subunit alcohol dehydrogenase family)